MDGNPARGPSPGADAELTNARRARRNLDPEGHLVAVDRLEGEVARLPPGPERDRLAWAATAERLRDIGFYETEEEALRRGGRTAEEGLAAVDRDQPDVSARFRLALGQVAARIRGKGWVAEATNHLNAAARDFIDADEHEEAAATLTMLAWSVQLTGGGLHDAHDTLTEALALSPDPSMRAGILGHRAQVHLWLGALDDAQADIEAAWSLTPQADDRAVAYVAWYAAVIASLRGQRTVVESWVRRGDERRGGFTDNNVTGLWYDAMIVDALARVGAVEQARERLTSLLAHAETEPTPAGLAQVSVEARFGDLDAAVKAWEALRARPDIETWEVARLRLLLALAAEREGHDPAPIAAEAFDLCAGLEEPAVLLTIEPDVARAFLPTAAAAGSVVASRLHDDRPRWRVQVLGDFAVHRPDGEELALNGQVRRVVAHLAVTGQPLTRSELGSLLWPHDNESTLQGRTRQLLHRARKQLPEVLTSDGSGRLGLSPEVVVDLDRFRAALGRAWSAQDDVLKLAAARAALSHLGGDLLADDVVDTDWLADVRGRHSSDVAWLHTVLAEEAHAQGKDDRALGHVRAALAADPTAEQAAALGTDLLRRTGRRRQAQALSSTTTAELAALGLEPGPDLRDAQARLKPGQPPAPESENG